MLIFPLLDFNDIDDIRFLTEKEGIIYAYAFSGSCYIGTATEIKNKLEERGILTEEGINPIARVNNVYDHCYEVEGIKIPRDNNTFLVTLEIKCIN